MRITHLPQMWLSRTGIVRQRLPSPWHFKLGWDGGPVSPVLAVRSSLSLNSPYRVTVTRTLWQVSYPVLWRILPEDEDRGSLLTVHPSDRSHHSHLGLPQPWHLSARPLTPVASLLSPLQSQISQIELEFSTCHHWRIFKTGRYSIVYLNWF